MKKNYTICTLMIFSLFFLKSVGFLYAEEIAGEQTVSAEQDAQNQVQEGQIDSELNIEDGSTDETLAETDSAAARPSIGRLVFTLGAAGILNTDKNSAPSPVLFSVGAGAQFRFYENRIMSISAAPHGQFFASFYFWDKSRKLVLPAEPEQRIAYVPAIMVDSPVLFHFPVKKSVFAAGIGPSFLIRFAARAIKVPSSEDNNIRLMNEWFWQNGRFFYPSLHLSWDYIFPSGIAAGIGLKAYLSTGGLVDKRGLDGSMITFSARLIPERKK